MSELYTVCSYYYDNSQVLYSFDGKQVENGLTCNEGDTVELVEDCGEWLWVGKDGIVCVVC